MCLRLNFTDASLSKEGSSLLIYHCLPLLFQFIPTKKPFSTPKIIGKVNVGGRAALVNSCPDHNKHHLPIQETKTNVFRILKTCLCCISQCKTSDSHYYKAFQAYIYLSIHVHVC